MRRSQAFFLQRGAWYLAGLVLFFAPFGLFPRLLNLLFPIHRNFDIHASCLRMPVGGLLNGQVALHGIVSVSFISFALLVVSAFLFGPFFCGRLCAAGAFPEYLGRLLPGKWKIDWYKLANPTPVRYGFFAGFLITPFLAGSLTCSFCSFSFMQRLLSGGFWGNFGVLGSTTIITAFLWLILFGVAARGGRGFCAFLCPIGALQSLLHSVGARLGFTYKLRYAKDKCVGCHACVKECPMGALGQAEGGVTYKVLDCLTCRQCTAACPTGALTYGRGSSGWTSEGAKWPWRRKKPSVVVGLLVLTALVLVPLGVFGASAQAYRFDQNLSQVVQEIKQLKLNPFAKLSLRLKVTEVLTYNSQNYPEKVLDPKEIGAVIRDSVKFGNNAEKTASAVYAVDLARKMDLTTPQVQIVRRVVITGQGNLRKEGIPQLYLDTVATYASYELPPCCL
jgi:polyferredoxin